MARDEPFPTDALGDLLAIVRAVHADRARLGADVAELRSIGRIAKDLELALRLGAGARPGSPSFATALERADRATVRAGALPALASAARGVVLAPKRSTGAP